jgi:hypothetical protein
MRIIDDLVDDSAPMNVKSSLEELIPEERVFKRRRTDRSSPLRFRRVAGKGRKTMFISIVRLNIRPGGGTRRCGANSRS